MNPRYFAKKPNVYLAGKIRKSCWRHPLIPDLRESSWEDAPLPQEDFNYIGPFFVGCDHGCFHGESSHGSLATVIEPTLCGFPGQYAYTDQQDRIIRLCFQAIDQADLVFCYVDDPTCHGTLVEIGYAIAKKTPVFIAFAPGIASIWHNQFWFAEAGSKESFFDVEEGDLRGYLKHAIRRNS